MTRSYTNRRQMKNGLLKDIEREPSGLVSWLKNWKKHPQKQPGISVTHLAGAIEFWRQLYRYAAAILSSLNRIPTQYTSGDTYPFEVEVLASDTALDHDSA